MSIQSSSFHDLIQCISLYRQVLLYILWVWTYMTRSHMSIHLLLAFSEIVLRAEAGLIPASWTEYERCKIFQKKDLWLVHVSIRLSVFMPLGHPNLKQDVACNRNYSIGFQMTSMYLEWKLPHPPIPRFWADDGMTQECMKISCRGSWHTKTWRSRSSPEKQQTEAEDQNFCAALKQEPHPKPQIIDSLIVWH